MFTWAREDDIWWGVPVKKDYDKNPEKFKAASKRYYHENRTAVRRRWKEKYQADRDTALARNRERNRKYRERNRERLKQMKKVWRVANLEKARESGRRWAANQQQVNPTNVRENKRRYYRNHREQEIDRVHRRQRFIAESPLPEGFLSNLLKRQKNQCAEPSCQKAFGPHRRPHLDHILPLKLGGRHEVGNLQFLCSHCNHVKAAQHPNTWARKHGRLF